MPASGRVLAAALAGASLLFSNATAAFDILQPLPERPPVPADNPITDAKVRLGTMLYFDARLSHKGTRTCNSCHNLFAGGDDDGAARRMATAEPLQRAAPTLWNVAFQTVLFMDGRAKSLEDALHEHLVDPAVMANPGVDGLTKRLEAIPGYRDAFAKAFPGQAVSYENATRALASFIRTLLTPDSPFDRYIKGNKSAISEAAKRGLKHFDDIGCLSCHFGVNFAGPAPGPAMGPGDGFYELFPNHLGSRYDAEYALARDLGRYYVTDNPGDKHMWRVPILRNIALTAPYFHNGSVDNLAEAVRVMAVAQYRRELTDQETADIVAFLETLTGKRPEITVPTLPDTPSKSLVAQPLR